LIRTCRFLLADDDAEVRLGVADLLSDLGLELLHAQTGLEAIELGRRGDVHGALFDMHMPGCTGTEVISILRQERIELPCLVYSGRWSPGLERSVLAAGAMACLKKPVEPDLLRRAVREALGLGPENHN
jgi:CheY-like chemotaxis protein